MMISIPAVVAMAIIAVLSPDKGQSPVPPIRPTPQEGKLTKPDDLPSSSNMVSVGGWSAASLQAGRETNLGKWMYIICKVLNFTRLFPTPQNIAH